MLRKEPIMKEEKTPKKPLFYYYGLAMLIILLLNVFVFPALLQKQVTETSSTSS